MPKLSANTLFHFTKLDSLINILETGFQSMYSNEVLFEDGDGNGIEMQIPMVCFCDIPLTSLDNHFNRYGKYGIGLTKEWGIEKGLNPVFYIQQRGKPVIKGTGAMLGSFITQIFEENEFKARSTTGPKASLSEVFSSFKIEVNKREAPRSSQGFLLDLLLKEVLLPYIKMVRGKSNYNYYDEKEWRFVPDIDTNDLIRFDLSEKEERINASVNLAPPLSFDHRDIKYIILEHESDIEPLRDKLRQIHQRTSCYPIETIDILTSRIITCKQIREDF